MPAFLAFLSQSTTAQAGEGFSVFSFFIDEGLSEKQCLQKHSFADCLHPLQGSREGSKNPGRAEAVMGERILSHHSRGHPQQGHFLVEGGKGSDGAYLFWQPGP